MLASRSSWVDQNGMTPVRYTRTHRVLTGVKKAGLSKMFFFGPKTVAFIPIISDVT